MHSPLHPAVSLPLELKEERSVAAQDTEALKSAWRGLCEARGVSESLLNIQALEAYTHMDGEMPAVNAVLGGVIANDLIKAASSNGEPLINNMFLFSLVDGAGWVERLVD
jgi:hypothetical protein